MGLWLRVSGSGLMVYGFGLMAEGVGFMVYGLWLMVNGLGFIGLQFMVHGCGYWA